MAEPQKVNGRPAIELLPGKLRQAMQVPHKPCFVERPMVFENVEDFRRDATTNHLERLFFWNPFGHQPFQRGFCCGRVVVTNLIVNNVKEYLSNNFRVWILHISHEVSFDGTRTLRKIIQPATQSLDQLLSRDGQANNLPATRFLPTARRSA